MVRKTKVKQHKRKGKVVKKHTRRIKGKVKKRKFVLSPKERAYIEATYNDEPEELPYYEVESAIEERREFLDELTPKQREIEEDKYRND